MNGKRYQFYSGLKVERLNGEEKHSNNEIKLSEFLYEVLNTAVEVIPCGLKISDISRLISEETGNIVIRDANAAKRFEEGWNALMKDKRQEYKEGPGD